MAAHTAWRVIRTSKDPKFMVKGYELADCFYARHRFRIAEVRAMIPDPTLFANYYMGTQYRVFDAHGVSDAEVAAGKSPPPVGTFPTFDEATAFCDAQP
jgi:hypothetical protein